MQYQSCHAPRVVQALKAQALKALSAADKSAPAVDRDARSQRQQLSAVLLPGFFAKRALLRS